MTTAYGYDGLNQLAFIDHKDGAAVAQSFDYTYDKVGNITSVTHEDGSTWDYLYDGRYRLTSAVRSGGYSETYTYDAGDNMTSKTVTAAGQAPVVTTFSSGANNELLSMSDGTTTTTFAYDDWGRQIAKADGTYTTDYGYRYGQMLHTVDNTDPGVDDVTYEYGGDGKRRSRTAGADYTAYNWSGMQLINEEDVAGALTNTHIHNPFRIWGSVLAEAPGANPATAVLSYYTHGVRGSTVGLFDAAKNIVGAFEYNPYGDLRSQTAPEVMHMYTGQIWDPITQLNLFTMRTYSSSQGRWLTREPLGLDGPNLYGYVGGNPISYVDFHGLFGFIGGALGALGGAIGGGLLGGFRAWGEGRKFSEGLVGGAKRGAIIGGLVGAFGPFAGPMLAGGAGGFFAWKDGGDLIDIGGAALGAGGGAVLGNLAPNKYEGLVAGFLSGLFGLLGDQLDELAYGDEPPGGEC